MRKEPVRRLLQNMFYPLRFIILQSAETVGILLPVVGSFDHTASAQGNGELRLLFLRENFIAAHGSDDIAAATLQKYILEAFLIKTVLIANVLQKGF